MKKIISLMLSASFITLLSNAAYAYTFDGHIYAPCYKTMKWGDAERYCEDHGGHLVTITSADENNFVNYVGSNNQSYWIGATCSYSLSWVTGENASYAEPFEAGEPSTAAKYVVFRDGYWTNLSDRELYFICEWEPAYSRRNDRNITVRVNCKELIGAQGPVIVNDYTFVPLRAIVEALGVKVVWHAENQSIELIDIKNQSGSTFFKIGSTQVESGGGINYIPVAPFILNDTTMVPFRVIGEMYGEVLWDDATRTADIFSLY